MKYHKEHGIEALASPMPVHTDTFKIRKMVHLKQVSELTGAPLEELQSLNPQYRHNIIPGNDREYILRIPYKFTDAFIAHEDSLHRHKDSIYFNPLTIKKIKDGGDGQRIVYRVKSGDYLGKIANKYRVSVTQIRRWNNLKSTEIRVGQILYIYGSAAPSSSSSSSSSSSASSSSSSKSSSTSSTSTSGKTYTVKNGDSLYNIAKLYPGVSAEEIKAANGLKSDNIKPGQVLKIPL